MAFIVGNEKVMFENICWQHTLTVSNPDDVKLKEADSKIKQDNSKLCEFCIYRVSFITGTLLKVSVYIVNCAEKSARIYQN